MPVFAALRARCTVLDYSDMQLANERLAAEREGYAIDIIKADMSRRLPFADACFDLVFHPVSNCYVEDVFHIWNECCRVLKPGGVLLAGMDNGVNFLFEDIYKGPLVVANRLPFNPLTDRRLYEKLDKAGEGIQFSHTRAEIINDWNGGIINFCDVLQRDFVALEKEVMISLHSRKLHRQAEAVYNNPGLFGRMKRAWAVWVPASGSYGCKLDGSFGYDRTGGTSKKPANTREAFTIDYAVRLQKAQIECRSARTCRTPFSIAIRPMPARIRAAAAAVRRRTSAVCSICLRPSRGNFS